MWNKIGETPPQQAKTKIISYGIASYLETLAPHLLAQPDCMLVFTSVPPCTLDRAASVVWTLVSFSAHPGYLLVPSL